MENKNTEENKKKRRKYTLIYVIVAFLFIYIGTYTRNMMTTDQVSYSEFITMVEDNTVDKVLISSSEIKIYPKEDNKDFIQGKVLYTVNVNDDNLVTFLKENNIDFSGEKIENSFITELIFTWLIMPLAFYFIFKFFLGKMSRKMGGGPMMKLGKSNAKVYKESDIKITFDDVAGQDEAKESLKEIIDYLNHAEKYKSIGAKLPKGALLVGPPGTGKTLLAKAVAGEANVPFLSISGSNFVEMFAGMGAAKVRDLFEEAEKNAPCIIFIDEIDSIGKSRDSQLQTNDEREQTLNQLLTQMDGFDSSKAVVVLGATNRPEILDKALLRPGRFDRRVIVDRPDLKGRIDILKVHVKGVKLGEDVDLREIAKSTPGAVGADLANMVNEGALSAVKHNREFVMQEDLREAVEVIIAGKEKKDRILSPKEKRIVAFHEVGHALVAALLEGADPVHKITIVPRTMGALGYTMQLPEEEKYLVSKDELINQIMVMLGGRSAEEEVFNLVSTGASNDIERATQTARSMVTVYGMTDKFDMMALESVQNRYLDGRPARNCSEETSTLIDSEVLNIIKTCHESSRKLLNENRDLLDEISEYLLEKETIFGDEFMDFIYKKYPELKAKKCKKLKEENTDPNKEIICTEDSKDKPLENKVEEVL
ncbi:ATP-dependent zinc metalloprotease FtsH [Clostridium sp.]|uniref:ATP-dependent zinc metalloprotease FtsH n=1 Tax=Clostridium sp. TaxID=1506 RepID=UPI00262B926D|nr:ATP-dependent zinc metalloprotease FtsH [Clostridium sp.]